MGTKFDERAHTRRGFCFEAIIRIEFSIEVGGYVEWELAKHTHLVNSALDVYRKTLSTLVSPSLLAVAQRQQHQYPHRD